MITFIKGNILDATEHIIGHQVNCMRTMDAGLAKQIKERYPNIYEEYKKFIENHEQMYHQGHAVEKYPIGLTQFVKVDEQRVIANIFGQVGYGSDNIHTDYDALRAALEMIFFEVNDRTSPYYEKSIALPYGLGCGLGGGSWDDVYQIIHDIFGTYGVTLYKLPV